MPSVQDTSSEAEIQKEDGKQRQAGPLPHMLSEWCPEQCCPCPRVHHVGHPCPTGARALRSTDYIQPGLPTLGLFSLSTGVEKSTFPGQLFLRKICHSRGVVPQGICFSFSYYHVLLLGAQKSTNSFQQSDPAFIRIRLYSKRIFPLRLSCLFLKFSFSSFFPFSFSFFLHWKFCILPLKLFTPADPIHELNTKSFPLSFWTNVSKETHLGICPAHTTGVKFLELSTIVRKVSLPRPQVYLQGALLPNSTCQPIGGFALTQQKSPYIIISFLPNQ